MNRLDEIHRKVAEFHRAHPEVWELFVRFAHEKIAAGFEHYSVGAVFERVRWETDAGAGAPELKFNNNYRAFYARRFHRLFPEHDGFFRTRRQTSEDRPATGLPEFRDEARAG